MISTIAYRIATNPDFVSEFQDNPQAALQKAGIYLAPGEIAALQAVIGAGRSGQALIAPKTPTPDDLPGWRAAETLQLKASA